MGEDTFDELEDIEAYILSFPIKGDETPHRRFEWTSVAWPRDKPEDLHPFFESEFYTFRYGAIAGGNLLKTIDGIAQRLLAMLEDVEGTPLPSVITDAEDDS